MMRTILALWLDLIKRWYDAPAHCRQSLCRGRPCKGQAGSCNNSRGSKRDKCLLSMRMVLCSVIAYASQGTPEAATLVVKAMASAT